VRAKEVIEKKPSLLSSLSATTCEVPPGFTKREAVSSPFSERAKVTNFAREDLSSAVATGGEWRTGCWPASVRKHHHPHDGGDFQRRTRETSGGQDLEANEQLGVSADRSITCFLLCEVDQKILQFRVASSTSARAPGVHTARTNSLGHPGAGVQHRSSL
jgi:hypothetical protein